MRGYAWAAIGGCLVSIPWMFLVVWLLDRLDQTRGRDE